MRLANLAGRAALVTGEAALDVADASDGRFGPDPMQVLRQWDDFRAWAADVDQPTRRYDPADLGPPVPRPRQIFAVALNYRPHAREGGYTPPDVPLIFTKFPSCLTGPYGQVRLPDGKVDWELELVAVVARESFQVPVEEGWRALAGVTVGQDISERALQMTGTPPQFSLAKSHPGFGPTGPHLVTLDELDDPADVELVGSVDGEVVQQDRTSNMIFPVPRLVAFISSVCPLYPGDLIFTGTPAGVGNRRNPPRYLAPGNVLVSTISGVGEMRHTFASARG